MKKIIKNLIIFLSLLLVFCFNFSLAISDKIKSVLDDIRDDESTFQIISNDPKKFIQYIGKEIMIPIVVVIGILLAFIAFYKLALSDKEDERKAGINYLLWGTIGVIVMTSAGFLVSTIVGDEGSYGILGTSANKDPLVIASNLYEEIIKNFFVLAMYFVVGILFVILVINLIKFLSSGDKEDVQKHAKTIIVWNSIGIILIMFAKNIIEMFYKKMQSSYSLGNQSPILENKDLGWLATVLNYFLGFIAFIITAFIIYQSFLLLTKPDDEGTYKSLKKYFVYAMLGVLLIGGVYVIANFFIIK